MKKLVLLVTALALSGCAVGWSRDCDTDNPLCAMHYRKLRE